MDFEKTLKETMVAVGASLDQEMATAAEWFQQSDAEEKIDLYLSIQAMGDGYPSFNIAMLAQMEFTRQMQKLEGIDDLTNVSIAASRWESAAERSRKDITQIKKSFAEAAQGLRDATWDLNFDNDTNNENVNTMLALIDEHLGEFMEQGEGGAS